MAECLHGCKDDDRSARSPDPSLRHHRNRKRQLALQEPRRRSHNNPRSRRLRNPDQLRRRERYRPDSSNKRVKIGRRSGVKFASRLTLDAREISRLLKLSRNTVRRILRAHDCETAASSPCDAQTLSRLEDAFIRASGNVVRVQQLLVEENDLHISYSTLTRWIRDAGLRSPPRRSGEYQLAPGAEAQHDTSPHRVMIAGKLVIAHCAGLVLAY